MCRTQRARARPGDAAVADGVELAVIAGQVLILRAQGALDARAHAVGASVGAGRGQAVNAGLPIGGGEWLRALGCTEDIHNQQFVNHTFKTYQMSAPSQAFSIFLQFSLQASLHTSCSQVGKNSGRKRCQTHA